MCILDIFILVWVPLNKALEWQEECLDSLETFCSAGPSQERWTRRMKMGRGEPDPCHVHTHVAPVSPKQISSHPSPVFLLSHSHTAETAQFYTEYSRKPPVVWESQKQPSVMTPFCQTLQPGSEGVSAPGSSVPVLCLCPPTVRKCLCWTEILLWPL